MPRWEKKKEEVVEEVQSQEADESTLALQRAAELLGKAATDKKNQGTLLKEVEAALSKVRMIDFPQLAESPVIQSFLHAVGVGDLKPGEVANRGTLAEREREWTWRDVNDQVRAGKMRLVKFIPYDNLNLTWNGLQLHVCGGDEVEVPDCFYDIYKEHQKARKEGEKNMQYLLGHSDAPPHPDWQTPEGAMVRAWSLNGRKYGRPSGTLEVGYHPGNIAEGTGE